jgi:hypothetical protein
MIITLGPDDVAIVLRGDGKIETLLPAHEVGDMVPDNVLPMMMLSDQLENIGVDALAEQFKEIAREHIGEQQLN